MLSYIDKLNKNSKGRNMNGENVIVTRFPDNIASMYKSEENKQFKSF